MAIAEARKEMEAIAAAADRGLIGLRGHRSVGGLRASIYNAFPRAGCVALVDFLKEVEREKGGG